MEIKRRMTLIKGEVKGSWLQDVMDALDIKVSDLVAAINAPNRRTIDKHLHEGNIGISYLWAIKKAYPQVNLNYLVAGESPVLLKPEPKVDDLKQTLYDIRDRANDTLGSY